MTANIPTGNINIEQLEQEMRLSLENLNKMRQQVEFLKNAQQGQLQQGVQPKVEDAKTQQVKFAESSTSYQPAVTRTMESVQQTPMKSGAKQKTQVKKKPATIAKVHATKEKVREVPRAEEQHQEARPSTMEQPTAQRTMEQPTQRTTDQPSTAAQTGEQYRAQKGSFEATSQFSAEGLDQKKGRRPRPITPETRTKLLQNPPKTLREVLEKFCLQELALAHWLQKRPILVGDFQTLERALSRINAHEIRSLPVVNKDKIVIGCVDVMDLTRSIADSLKTMGDQTTAQQSFEKGKMRNDFMSKSVSSLLTPDKKKCYVAANHISLLLAIEYLVRTGQERFLIVDRDVSGNVSEQNQPEEFLDGIVTQADCIKFLAENISLLRQEPLFQKTLNELGLGRRRPYTISHNEQAANAFIDMADRGFDSAAVVDDNGKLKACISASDLKGLTRRNCVILTETVEDFLNRDWKRGWWTRPLTVDLNDPLFFVVLQFVSSKVHRMYICTDDGTPTGEVNLLDILKILLQIR